MRFACLSLLAFLLPTATLRADDAADAKAIVARAVKAAGIPTDGKPDAMTYKFKGKSISGGLELPYTGDLAYQAPDKYRLTLKSEIPQMKLDVTVRRGVFRRATLSGEIGGMTIDMMLVVNGNKAWESALGVSREVTGESLEKTLTQVYELNVISLAPLLAEKEFKLSTAGEKEVNGKKMATVKVERDQKLAMTLSFDKETGLLAKVELKSKDELQGWKEVFEEVYFEDYKDIGGRKYYTKMRNFQDGKPSMEATISDYQRQEKLDPKLFEAIK